VQPVVAVAALPFVLFHSRCSSFCRYSL